MKTVKTSMVASEDGRGGDEQVKPRGFLCSKIILA
jgi:hypothetical protein